MVRALAALVAALILATPAAVHGQPLPECSFVEDWRLPPLPGQVAVAQRVFAPSADAASGLGHLNPNVAEFETPESAAAAFPVLVTRLRSSEIGDVRSGVGTDILDESVVFAGTVPRDGVTVEFAQLLFRDGRYLHSWQASAIGADPVPPMLEIVGRLLRGRDPLTGTPPAATPDLARLFAQLPDVDDVPAGFAIIDEGCGVRRATAPG